MIYRKDFAARFRHAGAKRSKVADGRSARVALGIIAGFGQIETQVIRVGMTGEAACASIPWTIPLVATEVQDGIAAGQARPTDAMILRLQAILMPGRPLVHGGGH